MCALFLFFVSFSPDLQTLDSIVHEQNHTNTSDRNKTISPATERTPKQITPTDDNLSGDDDDIIYEKQHVLLNPLLSRV